MKVHYFKHQFFLEEVPIQMSFVLFNKCNGHSTRFDKSADPEASIYYCNPLKSQFPCGSLSINIQ